DPIRATRLSLAIGKLTAQTRTLRRIAELQSQQQAEATEQGSEKLGPNVNRAPIVAAPTVAGTSGTFIMLSANQREFGRRFPDYPDASEISAATIKATVPPTAPGHAYVVPVGFSNFNEKFSYLRYLNNLDFAGGDTGILAVGQHTRFPRFVLIESGVFDMPSLVRLLQSSDVGSVIEKVGRHYQINVPLLIGQNATLVVSEADVDELRLNTAAAAYLINSGRFYLVGAKLTSWDPGTATPSPRSAEQWADFNSFYVGWSGSETYIAEAQVSSLGYASGKSYGFTLSSGPTRVLSATWNTTPRPKGIIVDSVFDQMYYGFYSYEASDVWIVGNHFKNNHIYAIDPHDRSNNLVIQNNAASSTKEKHGIILSRDVTHSTIVGNITFDSGGSGIMLDRSSDENVVAYNLSFGNNNDGLTVFESSCNLVSSNTMYGNGRDGVRIRNSWDILLSANGIESNGSAGIFAYTAGLGGENGTGRDLETDPYYVYSDLIAVRNRLKGNAVAMGAAGVSAVQVGGNDFAVAPDERLLSSDLAEAGFGFLSASAEGAVLRDVCRPLRPAESCSLREDGYFGSDIVAEIQAASTPQSLLAGRGCEPRSAVPVRIEATSQ
ncbi:MAG: right-handed parallel beta-helix repeat-containing protein, partial [Propylenella sp.]